MSSSSSEFALSLSGSNPYHGAKRHTRYGCRHANNSSSSMCCSSSSSSSDCVIVGQMTQLEKSLSSITIGCDLLEMHYEENRNTINEIREEIQELLDLLLHWWPKTTASHSKDGVVLLPRLKSLPPESSWIFVKPIHLLGKSWRFLHSLGRSQHYSQSGVSSIDCGEPRLTSPYT